MISPRIAGRRQIPQPGLPRTNLALDEGFFEAIISGMSAWEISSVSDEAAPGCDLVRQWLREHNWAVNPDFMLQRQEQPSRPLVLLASADACVIGGLFAETPFAWLRISIMSVAPGQRSRGLGTALLVEAGRIAMSCGCAYAYVDTMDYQAPRFYLAHGYAVAGEVRDWDSRGHTKLFLTKRLPHSARDPL